MGIRLLNKYIKTNCKKGVNVIKMENLRGKYIVIDTSIYLYRFLQEEVLLENFYLLLSLLKYYNITGIFVFDGKPPEEKYKLIQKRNSVKAEAREKYKELEIKINEINDNEYEKEGKNVIENEMVELKKKFVKLERYHIDSIKKLITAFGESYIDAEGEADQLCAKLVIKKIAYACLSEDMDLFLYGCPRVLRYLSLLNESMVLYNLSEILKELEISLNDFRQICVLSGTDYNDNNNGLDLYKSVEFYKSYKNDEKNNNNNIDFYTWIDNNMKGTVNIIELYVINNMFLLDNVNLKRYKINRTLIDKNNIKEIMKQDGFIFVN
jgi:flap endonuclease-1